MILTLIQDLMARTSWRGGHVSRWSVHQNDIDTNTGPHGAVRTSLDGQSSEWTSWSGGHVSRCSVHQNDLDTNAGPIGAVGRSLGDQYTRKILKLAIRLTETFT
ncbi:hypothetical protein RRG08_003007 [Elysia crispata]|uniref:Uncharacterized protein n=1 Tax=Elysia crispata TaxID=231223 RepID=A0AAE1B5D8_9GAST|nr:hypothetical protein RRG08_003007 [Elysia crispata]